MNKPVYRYEAVYEVEGLVAKRFREFSCTSDEEARRKAESEKRVISDSLFMRKTKIVSLHRIERHEVDINV